MSFSENDYDTEILELEESLSNCIDQREVLWGKYRVEGILGKGGMATVYLCTNIKLGNLWAIKHIVKELTIKEEDVLKKLNHVYLPKIADVFHDSSGIYIVESYIEGINLQEKMDKEGPFRQIDIIQWVNQLTEVLSYLHNLSEPIIYRDLKPSNIIITPDNKAILVDFGISTTKTHTHVNRGLIAATAKFAAPEQLKGFADERTDIYNLGVMLYYLLTGEIINRKAKELPFHKNTKKFMKIIKKATEEEADDRYQSIEELRRDILNLQEDNFLNKNKHIEYLSYGTNTIGCVGVSNGVGTTHTAILIACFLSKKYRVAMVEMNSSSAFRELYFASHGKKPSKDSYAIKNVHYYFDISYPQFITEYRRNYDFVILDFGSFNNMYADSIEEFARTDENIVIAHGVDWKIREAENFYNNTEKYDPKRKWHYIIPFLDNKDINQLRKSISNKMYTLPLNVNPFIPSNNVESVFKAILGIKKQKNSSRSLFNILNIFKNKEA